MKQHDPKRLLKSLIRERQRLFQMYFNNGGQIRITVEAGNAKTVLRDDVVFPHRIVEAYMTILNRRIDALLKNQLA